MVRIRSFALLYAGNDSEFSHGLAQLKKSIWFCVEIDLARNYYLYEPGYG
jgi:hypothetical protein